MTGLTDLDEILRTLRPSVRAGAFVYVVTDLPLPSHASVVEREGGSLVVEQAVADEAGLSYEGTFAWITLQVHSSLQAVGLTAAVSSALAQKGVPCNMLAGFYHDHILVPSDRVIDALAVLQNLSQR
ncbi:ACT domain-containing protein [Tessaracoccus caeni]|uniref:ACT domain-containing protein n=1 Tax=Tessaracoccus caeni TaxID=3031239 RepID=UPI0023DA1226|nr:ACT domain-containing protein [Tessaracoccus caeni]MDF1489348.1 ACT domain-containing protein [Tessaracoccus caeni]